MKLKLMKSTWGMTGSYEQLFKRISDAGYAGVETSIPSAGREQEFRELLTKYQLEFIAQIYTSGDHERSFSEQVIQAVQYDPVLIVSHSARDCMGWKEQKSFFQTALAVEEEVGIQVAHETHRHRAMFTPWNTAALLDEFPALKIAADFSHWCCVCESLLEDQSEVLHLAMERTIHVHARVGHSQGPQVPHPGAPEYAAELAAHEAWWRQIVKNRIAGKASFLSITPEYGPPNYMPTLPFTNQPVSELWDICLWNAKRLEALFPDWCSN